MKTTLATQNTKAFEQSDWSQNMDDLVLGAARGDETAIAHVAAFFGDTLQAQARGVMGPFSQDAEDVVQDFLLSLVERRSPLVPERGRAISWMFGVVRAAARKYRAEREQEWGLEGDGPG